MKTGLIRDCAMICVIIRSKVKLRRAQCLWGTIRKISRSASINHRRNAASTAISPYGIGLESLATRNRHEPRRKQNEMEKKRRQEVPTTAHNTHTAARLGAALHATILMMSSLFLLFTFGKSRMWFASNNNSSKLLEYRRMSSGTFGSEQCRLSTNSTWRLHPLKIGMHLNIVSNFSFLFFYLTKLQTSWLSRTSLWTEQFRSLGSL